MKTDTERKQIRRAWRKNVPVHVILDRHDLDYDGLRELIAKGKSSNGEYVAPHELEFERELCGKGDGMGDLYGFWKET